MPYPPPVMRTLHIALTALLVATHAFAVPWHVVVEHGLSHNHAGEVASLEHVHGPEDAHLGHGHEESSSPAKLAEVFDASGFGSPHHHDGHAHSVTDHGFSRSRAETAPFIPVAVLPAQVLLVHPAALQAVEANESPPPKTPRQSSSSLRGPPVA